MTKLQRTGLAIELFALAYIVAVTPEMFRPQEMTSTVLAYTIVYVISIGLAVVGGALFAED